MVGWELNPGLSDTKALASSMVFACSAATLCLMKEGVIFELKNQKLKEVK